MSEALTILKEQRQRLDEQIAPLQRALHQLDAEIYTLERKEALEAAGLHSGDLLATSTAFLRHIRVRSYEFTNGLAVAVGAYADRVIVQEHPDGSVEFTCPVAMALAMRAEFLQREAYDRAKLAARERGEA